MSRRKRRGQYSILDNRPNMKFRQVADAMTQMGQPMNYTSARGIFIRGMRRLADDVVFVVQGRRDPVAAERLSRDPSFHTYVYDLIEEVGCHDHTPDN